MGEGDPEYGTGSWNSGAQGCIVIILFYLVYAICLYSGCGPK